MAKSQIQCWVILDNENVQEYFEGCGTDVWDMHVSRGETQADVIFSI